MTQAQTQTLTDVENLPHADAAESMAVDESAQATAEGVAAVEQEAAAAPASAITHDASRPLKLMSVVDQTMRRAMSSSHNETLNTPRHNVGQGFAKWISKAVGTTALKEKTEIQDLPAYRLRVRSHPLPPPPPPSPPRPDLSCPSFVLSHLEFLPLLLTSLKCPPQRALLGTPFLESPSLPPQKQVQFEFCIMHQLEFWYPSDVLLCNNMAK